MEGIGGKRVRSFADEESSVPSTSKKIKSFSSLAREICQYGRNCYRRSPSHFKELRHPDLEALFLDAINNGNSSSLECIRVDDIFLDPDVVKQQLKILMECGIRSIIQNEISSEASAGVINITTTVSMGTEEPVASTSSFSPTTKCTDKRFSPQSSTNTMGQTQKTGSRSKDDVMAKWEASCPYNYFLTSLPQETNVPYSISFGELFDRSMGIVKGICHFNFMVDADWLLEETHKASLDDKETTVIYGVESPELEAASRIFPWLKVHLVKSPFPFGHHHTKMTLIEYIDSSIRFVISTANLIQSDWENRTQGLWISPRCPRRADGTELKSPGNFKTDLLQYLSSYPSKCHLGPWLTAVRAIDACKIKVVFVGTAPTTTQSPTNGFQWGEKKMEKALKLFPEPGEVNPNWPLVIQCSSIATLGQSDDWVRGELGRQLMGKSWGPSSAIRIVYPSDENVRQSFDGLSGGGCLPYSKATHLKQLWVRKLFHQWKAESCGRNRAMPHIKTYCRMSPDQKRVAWFLLTSANLSKAAWGKLNKNQDRLSIMSWEAGVLFIPQLFGSSEAFQISQKGEVEEGTLFLPYDVPLTKYKENDTPWHIDTLLELRPT